MRHCQSLPENDEMLRILRAMQFLTLLMVQVPGEVAAEREKLEQLFTVCNAEDPGESPVLPDVSEAIR